MLKFLITQFPVIFIHLGILNFNLICNYKIVNITNIGDLFGGKVITTENAYVLITQNVCIDKKLSKTTIPNK